MATTAKVVGIQQKEHQAIDWGQCSFFPSDAPTEYSNPPSAIIIRTEAANGNDQDERDDDDDDDDDKEIAICSLPYPVPRLEGDDSCSVVWSNAVQLTGWNQKTRIETMDGCRVETQYLLSRPEEGDSSQSVSCRYATASVNPNHRPMERNSNKDDKDGGDADTLGIIQGPVGFPLSVVLRVKHNSSEQVGTVRPNPLEHAFIKRSLVGKIFLFREATFSSEIRVPLLGDKGALLLHVKDVVCRKLTKETIVFRFLPSTRITIVTEPTASMNVSDGSSVSPSSVLDNGDDVSPGQVDISDPTHLCEPSVLPNIESPVAKLLLETLERLGSMTGPSSTPHPNLHTPLVVPRTFLLTGPPGVGKTFAVRTAVDCATLPVHLMTLQGSEILSNGSHVSEAATTLLRHFERAARLSYGRKDDSATSPQGQVAMVFLDECEALISSDTVAAMLAFLLDRVETEWERIVVVAATNRIDALPGWIRRPGRFDREIPMAPPSRIERMKILNSLISNNHGTFGGTRRGGLQKVAETCVGYVAADLTALVRRATLLAIRQTREMTEDDLFEAMKAVGASALRDAALSAPPKSNWNDVAGDAGGAKTALRRAVEWPRTKRALYEQLGLVPPRGILLHGPPGCAKTSLARAAAGASGVAFFSLSPADVYASSYVGEAEAVVRRAFSLARSAAPCILFFDEIDSIVGTNSGSGNNNGSDNGMGRAGGGKSAEARVLSTFLNEMDGVDTTGSDEVLVLGATNRPSMLDAALLRPGRFDNIIYVPPPDVVARKKILDKYCSEWSKTMDMDIDTARLASDDVTGLMTGAEIVGACREAAMMALRLALGEANGFPAITFDILHDSLRRVKPLLSNTDALQEYTAFEQHRSARQG